MHLIIAGIHTGIGKTVCSTVLAEALGFDYWKPVQAGDLDRSDSHFVRNHICNPITTIHKEAYRLTIAASPHYAAAMEGIEIKPEVLTAPATDNNLLIETAGGIMSPLGPSLLNIDLVKKWNSPAVLVCSDYLGSINHSLLSIAALKETEVPLLGLVFSGKTVPATRKYILEFSGLPLLLSIPFFEVLTRETICAFAAAESEKLQIRIHDAKPKR
jgi:dethiobiotin synthetase